MKLLLASLAAAGLVLSPERDERTSPTMTGADGQLLARGEQEQTVEGDALELRVRWDFLDGRVVSERSTFLLRPRLEQNTWLWEERQGGSIRRRFEVDFGTGKATAYKLERGGPHRWSEHLSLAPGTTFAGSGIVFVLKGVRARLVRGEGVTVMAVGMTPRPRVVPLDIRWRGLERIGQDGRTWEADHFTVHPDVGLLVELFVHVPDGDFWLTREQPPDLLRAEYPLLEPDDPVVRAETHLDPARDAAPR